MAREIKRRTTNAVVKNNVSNNEIPDQAETVNNMSEDIKDSNENIQKAEPHVFAQTDLIVCRSITQGEMFYPAKTSGILYRWSNFGDLREVEYRDLYSLKSERSSYLYSPMFIIEDERLLSDPRWKDIKEFYDTLYDTEDLNNIINLPIGKFEKTLKQMPLSLKQAIAIEVANRIEKGTFDSLRKIQAINEICDTELAVD